MMSSKKAFSLPEILMVLVIIGVIVVIMLNVIKPDDHIMKVQYMKAYNMLTLAAFNVYDDSLKDSTNTTGKLYYISNNKKLCQGLVKYINTTSSNCNGSNVDKTGSNLLEKTPRFIASNNMRFWMSEPFRYNTDATSTEHYHRIIWVDINGKRKPNIIKKDKRNPDIVAFDINDQGEVVPLGYPKVSRKYMQAKVVYPTDELNEKSYPMPFMEAQLKAFGGTSFNYDIMSYNYDQNKSDFDSSKLRLTSDQTSAFSSVGIADECKTTNADFPMCTVEIVP